MTTDPTPDLRDELAEALMRWAEGNSNPKYASMRRPSVVRQNAYGRADAVLDVINRRMPAAAPVSSPPADRAALRDRIAEVFAEHDWAYFNRQRRYALADAVLAVLPPTTDRDAEIERLQAELKSSRAAHRAVWEKHQARGQRIFDLQGENARLRTDRAAVLREANWIVEHCPDHGCVEPETDGCHCEIAERLRRMADETPAAEAQPPKLPPMDPVHILGIEADDAPQDGARPSV